MLYIRTEQLQALEMSLRAGFVERLVDFLLEEWMDAEVVSRQELVHEVRGLTERAQQYRLETGAQVGLYVVVAATLGHPLELRYPEVREALDHPSWTPDEKADWLETWSRPRMEEPEEPDDSLFPGVLS